MKQRHVSIKLTGPGRADIALDGQPLTGVRGFRFGATVDEMGLVILDLNVPTGEIDGEMVAVIPEGTAETLLALGWTPPAEQAYGGTDRPKAWRHSCGEINEGAKPVMCGWCRFDATEHPEDTIARYVLVELPKQEGDEDAAPE